MTEDEFKYFNFPDVDENVLQLDLPPWPQINNQLETSNGVIPNQTDVSTVQASQSSTIPSASRLSKSYSSLTASERAMRKRKADQDYRIRSKIQRAEMQYNLERLTGENESLKNENVSFKENNSSMNQILRDQAKEIDSLGNDLLQLKRENEKQNVLVQTLSELLADPLRLENENLKDEIVALRKNGDLNSNLKLLAEETAKLRTENKVLKVQNDALCGKIISDNEKKHEQGILN